MRIGHKKETAHEQGRQKSYFKTILFSLLILSVTVTILLTAFLTFNYIRTSVSVTKAFNQNLLSQTNYTITQMNANVDRLTQALFCDKNIVSFLYMKEQDNMVSILASLTLDRQLVTLPYIDSIYLYNASLDLYFSSKTGEQLHSGDFKDRDIADRITDPAFLSTYDGTPIPSEISGSTHVAQKLSYVIFDSTLSVDGRKNAIIINASPSYLTASIRSMNQFKNGLSMDFVVMDADGTVISSVLTSSLEQNAQLYPMLYDTLTSSSSASNNNGFFRIGNTRYLRSQTRDNENNWYLLSLVPSRIIFKDTMTASVIGAGIMILVFLLCCLISLYFARRLNHPIQAITHIMKGEAVDMSSAGIQDTEEFGLILSSFRNVQDQNLQFEQMRRKTAYSARQDFLNSLLGSGIDSAEQTGEKLRHYNLTALSQHPLCMTVFKIDQYDRFLAENNLKELWLLRFAVVNILEETANAFFPCCVFSRDNDKFVILIPCEEETVYRTFQEKVGKMIEESQKNVERCTKLSLSAAYSTFFKGLEHLPSMYSNMKGSLQLKMKFGHGCIISPYMVDEVDTGSFRLPVQKSEQLIARLLECDREQTLSLYEQISSQLFQYDCNEILSCSIYLAYSIYTGLTPKYPGLREEGALLLRTFLTGLQDAEITSDITQQMNRFLMSLCDAVEAQQALSLHQNTDLIAQKMVKIIDRDYANPSLCLSSIAEEIGLSPNYIGQIFKTARQKSVAQYILELRMNKLAYYLDHTRLPLAKMLENVGIEKNNYFYTQFKKHFGVSLGAYRRGTEGDGCTDESQEL